MVGETGAGKTTLINTMVNYSMGIKFEDNVWNEITEGKDEGMTPAITIYNAFVKENLRIIDTPGYGQTGESKDDDIAKYLSRLFADEFGIRYIDAVCFVMKASQNYLSEKQSYIFDSVLSLFGRDMKNNIVFVLTHSDGLHPTDAINVITKAKIPCRRDENNQPVYFLFNNCQKASRDEQCEQNIRSAWEMGDENLRRFLALLQEGNRTSVAMTLDVLNERMRLDDCALNMYNCIKEKESKSNELNKIQRDLQELVDSITEHNNVCFTGERLFKCKDDIKSTSFRARKATCCSVCEENCHVQGCWWVKDLSWCSAMINNHCTVCTGKCHYTKHVKESKQYVMKTEKITLTFKELQDRSISNLRLDQEAYESHKTKYNEIIRQHEEMKDKQDKCRIDLSHLEQQKLRWVTDAYTIVKCLSKMALKVACASTLQHLDALICGLNELGEDESIRELMNLRTGSLDCQEL